MCSYPAGSRKFSLCHKNKTIIAPNCGKNKDPPGEITRLPWVGIVNESRILPQQSRRCQALPSKEGSGGYA